MKRILFILALAFTFLSGTAFAADNRSKEQVAADNVTLANTIGYLSDAQKLELLAAAQNISNGQPAGGEVKKTAASKATEWVGVGSAIGDGLVATAGKLGIEVNKFAVSPVGKMAMLLIVWHYMGEEISGWVAGTLWLLIAGSFWWRAAKRTFGVYNEKGKFINFDRAMLGDKAEFGMIFGILVVSGAFIGLVGVIFLA